MSTKVHVALNTTNFDASVAFYTAFLGNPVKHKPGYAKFDSETPGLNLTLNSAPKAELGSLNHLGIEVDSTDEVDASMKRIQAAGLGIISEERDVDCCYAIQDKFWVEDPDGRRWEIFTVKVGDTAPELQVAGVAGKTAKPGDGEACCAPTCCS